MLRKRPERIPRKTFPQSPSNYRRVKASAVPCKSSPSLSNQRAGANWIRRFAPTQLRRNQMGWRFLAVASRFPAMPPHVPPELQWFVQRGKLSSRCLTRRTACPKTRTAASRKQMLAAQIRPTCLSDSRLHGPGVRMQKEKSLVGAKISHSVSQRRESRRHLSRHDVLLRAHSEEKPLAKSTPALQPKSPECSKAIREKSSINSALRVTA